MRAASLFVVFVLAKVAALGGHAFWLSWWTPAACFWQDALAALLFACFERFAPKRASSIVFWILAGYAALNIPVMRAVSTPLTLPMWRAARGPLADSFRAYATWTNAALVVAVLAAAAISRRLSSIPHYRRSLTVLAASLAVVGPFASTHVDTVGFDRNAVAALFASAVPHLGGGPAPPTRADWRASRFYSAAAEDLSAWRGLARGRNIVLVALESTAARYLRLYGGEYDLMPNLSALASNAVVFDNAYAVYPESIKGLYSVLCSTYPSMDSQPEDYEKIPCRSIAKALADAGYRTGMFHSGRFGYLGMNSVIRNRGYQTLEDAGDIGGHRESSFGVDEPATVARMLSWIDSLPRGQRFFLTYLPIAGHHPYETPERGPFPERDDIGRYRNALLYGDAALGALRAGLRARGLDDNTVWIVYGDHGEAFGQHPGNYAHTFFIYEENVHVPFLIAAPGAIHSQIRARKVVSLVDTAPTVLDLAGLTIPDLYQGRSMLDGGPGPRMALFFTDYSLPLLGLRDGPWKFIYRLDTRRQKLFDLDRDPGERTNLASAYAGRVGWYEQVVRNWSASQRDYLANRGP
jgi:phosphoglycerol transferase MdoB-like AlkP superfamily enzyme